MASKTDYFNQMYEYARQAGLSDHLARLAVTQSALETGYGRSVKGNNYFGIKAGKSWNGPSQTFKTWEDVGGKRVNITDKFRKYDNPVDAFKDWEKMIGKRWPAALTAKDLPSAIDGLKYGQKGGYASDQKYKQKLMSIDRQGQRLYNNAPLFAGDIPIPTPRQPMFMMAKAIEADRLALPQRQFAGGGILDAPKVSLNPVSSANAGERLPQVTRSPLPAIQERIRPMPTGAPAKTSTGVGYSLPKAQPLSDSAFSARYSPPQPAPKPSGPQTLYNRSGGAANDFRPMPTGAIPQRIAPSPVQSAMRDRPMPSGPIAPQASPPVSPATMAAAYGQYGQTRMAAPATPMQANPAVPRSTINATGTAGTMIDAPITTPPVNNTFPAKPAPLTFGQKVQLKVKNAVQPDNLKTGLLTALGAAFLGPVGALAGNKFGNSLANNPQGQGLLAGLFGGGNNGYQGQSTYIGNGINAVDRAMYGNRAGDTATYNSQGGGTVTNLGNGTNQRTSSKYGWTETTHADGSKSIKYK